MLIAFLFSFVANDAVGNNGIVVSSNEISSQIGIDILKNGGNAFDAAVAVGFSLAVTHPSAGNIGGGGFMVIRLANGEKHTIDFREKAPSNSSRDMFLDDNGNVVPGLSWSSVLSSGVPGTVAGLGHLHENFGSMPWDKLLYPAVNLASLGYPLDYFNVYILNSDNYKNKLSADIETKKIFSKKNSYKVGDIFVQKDLSNTLKRIADFGYNEFYIGKTADKIIDCMNRTGGIISYDDLKNYKPIFREPINFTYRDYNIYSMPLPSSGGITLANILNQIENVDVNSLGFQSSEHVHYMVEAEKRAYADRALYLGDIDFVEVPVSKLISKEYAYNRFNYSSSHLSTSSYDLYDTLNFVDNESEETTHYSIVDKFGNAISVTTTLNGWYGNGITVDGAGFLLNNEMDDFSSKPGEPNKYGLIGNEANSIAPNKRMLSSMTPTIVEDSNNDLFLILGSPGGSTIITTVAQIIVNVIDFGMEIDEAVEQNRFHHQLLPDVIQLERFTLGNDVINNLISRGHDFIYRSKFGIGEANCIMIRDDNYYGGADSRRNAKAVAY